MMQTEMEWKCYLMPWDHFAAPIPRNHLGIWELLCGPFFQKKIHLSPSFQVTLLFLGLLKDAAIFSLHAQRSNSAESWRPCPVLWGKWEVRKAGGSFCEDCCCGMGVFSTSSLKWLWCLAQKEDQPFYLHPGLLCLPFGEVLTMAFSPWQAMG